MVPIWPISFLVYLNISRCYVSCVFYIFIICKIPCIFVSICVILGGVSSIFAHIFFGVFTYINVYIFVLFFCFANATYVFVSVSGDSAVILVWYRAVLYILHNVALELEYLMHICALSCTELQKSYFLSLAKVFWRHKMLFSVKEGKTLFLMMIGSVFEWLCSHQFVSYYILSKSFL